RGGRRPARRLLDRAHGPREGAPAPGHPSAAGRPRPPSLSLHDQHMNLCADGTGGAATDPVGRGALASVAYTWGSAPAERARPFPCDRWVEHADTPLFRAIDVEAPAAVVF